MPFINGLLKKKGLAQLVQYCYLKFGLQITVGMLDEVKELGFLYATRAGISIGIDDMVVPEREGRAGAATPKRKSSKFENQYQEGAITHGERYNKIIEIWSKVTEKVSDEMFKSMEEDDRTGRYLNPIYIMADSGARGSKQQIRQLSGMRGLMAKPSGEIIETPITANFREGLNVLQYFISTHGARKGLADTALKTADSGYLTRRLVRRGAGRDHQRERLRHRRRHLRRADHRIGRNHRAAARPYRRPCGARRSARLRRQRHRRASTRRSPKIWPAQIQAAGIERVKIRSVLTCESKRGVCVSCATAATWRPDGWWSAAKRSASSRRSPSASPARS